MLVYRCISDSEFRKKGIVNRKPIVIGDNTHKYLDDISYVHFFKYSQFAEYFFYIRKKFPDRCFVAYMVADIPDNILNNYLGYGFYRLYDFSIGGECVLPIPEYALPCFLFKDEYVVSVENRIPHQYASDQKEYEYYFQFLSEIASKFSYDFKHVACYLHQNDLNQLLKNYHVKIKEKSR